MNARTHNLYCSLDGVDFPIQEPRVDGRVQRMYYSHNLNRSGLRYGIGLSIATGDIVWAYGGYPCGEYPDLLLAWEAYLPSIDDGEMTVSDNGYQDPNYFIFPRMFPGSAQHQKEILSRHETINSRLKQFNVLKEPFRGLLDTHTNCFHAVVNIVQVMIDCGENLYQLQKSS